MRTGAAPVQAGGSRYRLNQIKQAEQLVAGSSLVATRSDYPHPLVSLARACVADGADELVAFEDTRREPRAWAQDSCRVAPGDSRLELGLECYAWLMDSV